jgi:hypothetical protein
VVSVSGDVIVDGAYAIDTAPIVSPTLTVGAGQTQIKNTTADIFVVHGTSREDGSGTQTMSWTGSAVIDEWATGGVAYKPAASGALHPTFIPGGRIYSM